MIVEVKPWHTRPAKPEEEALVIADLDARLRPFALELLNILHDDRTLDPLLIYGRRAQALQDRIVDAGNSQRRDSYHVQGLAFDVVDRVVWWAAEANDGQRDRTNRLWDKVGAYCHDTGLTWGGDWKSPRDPAHVQWKDGAQTLQAQSESALGLADTGVDNTTVDLPPVREAEPTPPDAAFVPYAEVAEVEPPPVHPLPWTWRLAACLRGLLGR